MRENPSENINLDQQNSSVQYRKQILNPRSEITRFLHTKILPKQIKTSR